MSVENARPGLPPPTALQTGDWSAHGSAGPPPAFCTACGQGIDSRAVICPGCGVPQGLGYTDPTAPAANRADGGGNALVIFGYILAVLLPIIGFILGIVAATRPAKAVSKHGVWIVVLSVVVFVAWLLFWLLVLAGISDSYSSGSYY